MASEVLGRPARRVGMVSGISPKGSPSDPDLGSDPDLLHRSHHFREWGLVRCHLHYPHQKIIIIIIKIKKIPALTVSCMGQTWTMDNESYICLEQQPALGPEEQSLISFKRSQPLILSK